MLGSPIRTPPDQRSVANSPGLIAGSHVLHRLLMPRHPPCALHSLSQQRHNHTPRKHEAHDHHAPHKPRKTTTGPPTITGKPANSATRHPPRNEEQQATPKIRTHSNCSHNTHTTRHDPPPKKGEPHPSMRVLKMLASTMQISNNNPTNPRNPTNRALGEGGPEAPDTPPDQSSRPVQCRTPDPSGPNSVPDPTPTNVRHE